MKRTYNSVKRLRTRAKYRLVRDSYLAVPLEVVRLRSAFDDSHVLPIQDLVNVYRELHRAKLKLKELTNRNHVANWAFDLHTKWVSSGGEINLEYVKALTNTLTCTWESVERMKTIVQHMQGRNMTLDKETLTGIISCCLESGDSYLGEEIFESHVDAGVMPGDNELALLLRTCVYHAESDRMLRLLLNQSEYISKQDPCVIEAALDVCNEDSNLGNGQKVLEILEDVPHGSNTMDSRINLMSKLNNLVKVTDILKDYDRREVQPTAKTLTIVLRTLLHDRAIELSDKAAKAWRWWEWAVEKGVSPDVECSRAAACIVAATASKVEEVHEFVTLITKLGHETDPYVLTTVLSAFSQLHAYGNAIKLWTSIKEENRFKLDRIAYAAMLDTCALAQYWNDGSQIISEIEELGFDEHIRTLDAMIHFHLKNRETESAWRVYSKMRRLQIIPTSKTAMYLFEACAIGRTPHRIKAIVYFLEDFQLLATDPDVNLITAWLRAYSENGFMQECLTLLHKSLTSGQRYNEKVVRTWLRQVFSGLAEQGDCDGAIQFVGNLTELSKSFDASNLAMMLKCCVKNGDIEKLKWMIDFAESYNIALSTECWRYYLETIAKRYGTAHLETRRQFREIVEKGFWPGFDFEKPHVDVREMGDTVSQIAIGEFVAYQQANQNLHPFLISLGATSRHRLTPEASRTLNAIHSFLRLNYNPPLPVMRTPDANNCLLCCLI